jgi:hypothetical protein
MATRQTQDELRMMKERKDEFCGARTFSSEEGADDEVSIVLLTSNFIAYYLLNFCQSSFTFFPSIFSFLSAILCFISFL